jgi:hypothetical protein
MDTTIHIDDQLFIRVQQVAQATGQSVDAIIANALTETLKNKQATASGEKFCFTRDRGKGVMPGVDINNSAELLDIMEEGQDVSHRH